MKHIQFGFLHLMCGKHGRKGKRKLSLEIEYKDTPEAYLFGISVRLLFVFAGFAIEIEKKQEEQYGDENVSQETTDDGSVQGS